MIRHFGLFGLGTGVCASLALFGCSSTPNPASDAGNLDAGGDAPLDATADVTTDAGDAGDAGEQPKCPTGSACIRWAVVPYLPGMATKFDICVALVDSPPAGDPPNITGPISAAVSGPGFAIPSVTNYFTFQPTAGQKIWTRLVKVGAADCTSANKAFPGTSLLDPVDAIPTGLSTLIIEGNANNFRSQFAQDTALDNPPLADKAQIRFFNGLADGKALNITILRADGGAAETLFTDTASYAFGTSTAFTMNGNYAQITAEDVNPMAFNVGTTALFTQQSYSFKAGGTYSVFTQGVGTAGNGVAYVCEDRATLYKDGQDAVCSILTQ